MLNGIVIFEVDDPVSPGNVIVRETRNMDTDPVAGHEYEWHLPNDPSKRIIVVVDSVRHIGCGKKPNATAKTVVKCSVHADSVAGDAYIQYVSG